MPRLKRLSYRRRNKRLLNMNWKLPVYRVLKQVHPEIGMTKKTMDVLNSFVYDMLRRITLEALQLSQISRYISLNAGDIQHAVRLVLSSSKDLREHAWVEGTKAVNKFVQNRTGKSLSGRKKKGLRRAPVQTTAAAGLQFPVPRIRRFLKEYLAGGANRRVQITAAVFLASVIEYLVAEVLELSGAIAKDSKRKLIVPRHMMMAIRNDDDLNAVTKKVMIASAGVPISIHQLHMPKSGGAAPVPKKKSLAPATVAPKPRKGRSTGGVLPKKVLAKTVTKETKPKGKSSPKTPLKAAKKTPKKKSTSAKKSTIIKKKIKIPTGKKSGAKKIAGKKKSTRKKK